MRIFSILLLASSALAFTLPGVSSILPLFARLAKGGSDESGNKGGKTGGNSTTNGGSKSNCPAIWNTIATELTQKFLTGGQCNPDARAAIRMVFHDCGGKSKILVPKT